MSLWLLLLIVVLLGVIPTWPYSNGWGYGPAGLLLVVLLVLVVFGRL